jgi:hypothetical protein
MSTDARAALNELVAALERHLEAAAGRRGENDPVVLAAYRSVAEAFEEYDDALLDAYDEVTPLEVFHGDDDDDEYDDEDDEDDDEDEAGQGGHNQSNGNAAARSEGVGGDDSEYDELDDPDDDEDEYTGLDVEDYDDESDNAGSR